MANSVNSIWTTERIDRLIELHNRRFSCSEMAAELGCGITRNAVIGKLHRLGITADGRPASEQERIKRTRAKDDRARELRNKRRRERRQQFREHNPPPPRAIVPLACADVTSLGVSLLDLKASDCRYPDGEGAGITFCGHPQAHGRSYCLPHARLTLSSDRAWSRGEMEANRRDRKAKFNQTLLEAAE